MKNALAFALSCVSAYAISFAADMLVGWVIKIYPAAVLKAVPTWIIIAAIAGIAALGIARRARFVVIPFVLVTLSAAFGGIVGRNYNFAVAGLMVVMSILVWALTVPKIPVPPYDPWKEAEKPQ